MVTGQFQKGKELKTAYLYPHSSWGIAEHDSKTDKMHGKHTYFNEDDMSVNIMNEDQDHRRGYGETYFFKGGEIKGEWEGCELVKGVELDKHGN